MVCTGLGGCLCQVLVGSCVCQVLAHSRSTFLSHREAHSRYEGVHTRGDHGCQLTCWIWGSWHWGNWKCPSCNLSFYHSTTAQAPGDAKVARIARTSMAFEETEAPETTVHAKNVYQRYSQSNFYRACNLLHDKECISKIFLQDYPPPLGDMITKII